jgi:Glycosyltransferase family 87
MLSASRRRSGRWRVWAPVSGLVLALLLAGLAVSLTRRQPPLPVPSRIAVRAALQNPAARHALAGSHAASIRTVRLDARDDEVDFYFGGQIVAQVEVAAGGHVVAAADNRIARVPYGDWIAYQPALLVVLCALFVLMTAVTPWRRLRNLDVAACLSLVVGVVLFQHLYLAASLVAALPGLAYLMLRCADRALGPAREPTAGTPLFTALTPGLDPTHRIKWLRGLLIVLALVFVMVGVSSTEPLDVIYAAMAGATRLIHGVLPYGHMPVGIVHGDTYPIFTYALYAPVALVAPVNSLWDGVDAGLIVAVLAALLAAWAVFRAIAGRRRGRPPEVEETGLRAALAWLAFPPLLITASTGTTDVALGTMLAIGVLLWRRPAACSAVLALAGWFKLAPFALLPLRLASLRGRQLAGALAAVAAVSVPLVGLLIVLGGLRGPADMVHAVSFQFGRDSLQSIWDALGIDRFQPLGEAGALGLIAVAMARVWREPELARDRTRMAALMVAILIALQLAANYWAFLYLAWVVPLVCFSLLADGLTVGETSWTPASARAAPEPVPAPVAP